MRTLTDREHLLISVALPVLLATTLWVLVAQPALESKRASQVQLLKIDQIRGALATAPIQRSRPAVDLNSSLQQRVTASAQTAGLSIRRLDPQGRALAVSLDDAGFEDVIRWIDEIAKTQALRVLSAEFGRLPEPGRISGRLLLEAI